MTSVQAFNDMMEQFLGELVMTFPEEKAMKRYQVKFDLARSATPRLTLDLYMQTISPYATMVMGKDENFFKSHTQEIPILEEMNIKNCWTDELSDSTKDAIWQYIQTLYILGTTITMFPPEMLSTIESAAAKCAADMQSSGGEINESTLSSMLNSVMGSDAMKMLQGPKSGR